MFFFEKKNQKTFEYWCARQSQRERKFSKDFALIPTRIKHDAPSSPWSGEASSTRPGIAQSSADALLRIFATADEHR
jgi:hypothetical protein